MTPPYDVDHKIEFETTVVEMTRMMDNFTNWYLFHDSLKPLSGKKVKVTVEVIKDREK